MSEEAAQVIWQIKLNDGLPWLAEVTKVRELMTQIMNTEDVATRTTLNALLMMARAELSNVMAALALPVVTTMGCSVTRRAVAMVTTRTAIKRAQHTARCCATTEACRTASHAPGRPVMRKWWYSLSYRARMRFLDYSLAAAVACSITYWLVAVLSS
jgi:hypothetical protein